VEIGPQGPLVYHGADFSLVTQANPAQAGELLIARAKGLGSTTPDLLPPGSRVFPGEPWDTVLAPVYVTVNKQEAEVVNSIGWPGTNDTYRVDFRLPGGTTAGMASVQLTLAWIPGSEVKIPVR